MTCICGREMSPVLGYDDRGWRLWYCCFDHPGMAKPSTGEEGITVGKETAAALVADGSVQAGPEMPQLLANEVYPTQPCHPNARGQAKLGRVLLGVFG